jgi:broad specificity phosphatase PhoE
VARASASADGAGGAVLVVSHGGSIRALIAAATGWRPPPMGNGDTYRVTMGPDDRVLEPALLP